MCGRYLLATTPPQITLRFDLQGELPEIPPRYNVVPEMTMPVVVSHSPNRLQLMRWGFLPRWAKDPKAVRQPINARSETVAESRMFGRSLRFQRCIVPASGFYEWQKMESRKQPQYITLRSGELLGLAGIWEAWTDKEGAALYSYAILTCEPNKLMAPIHNRMPVILRRDDEEAWLDPDTVEPERLLPLLRPYAAREMAAWPVSTAVNSPRNDSPALVQPAER